MKLHGLLIDPQVDFCDKERGTLFVSGADADMTRLSALIRRLGTSISGLHVTLDAHHRVDIAHPIWWTNADGRHPDPFTILTLAEIEAGQWRASLPERQERSRAYVAALANDGRYPLCIWPYHCLIGSPGQNVVGELRDAIAAWESATAIPTDFVLKGQNIWTEHYSAIKAEVPDPDDPHTLLNRALIARLEEADCVFVAGEAGSHCLANTVRDLVDAASDAHFIERIVLLTDATSPVPGFESLQEAFLHDLTARGMRTATTATFFDRA